MSADPAAGDTPPETAAQIVKAVAEAIPVPLIVYGPDDEKKNAAVLAKVAEVCRGQNLLLGPAVKENYEAIAKAVLEHGHCLIAQTSLDINLMKELNIKICKSFPPDRVVIDPISFGAGLWPGIQLQHHGAHQADRRHIQGRHDPDAHHRQPGSRMLEDQGSQGEPESRRTLGRA